MYKAKNNTSWLQYVMTSDNETQFSFYQNIEIVCSVNFKVWGQGFSLCLIYHPNFTLFRIFGHSVLPTTINAQKKINYLEKESTFNGMYLVFNYHFGRQSKSTKKQNT